MGADQFLLTWNNHRSNFAEVFSQLRFQDQLVDVTLLCDGGSYPAHRLVLAACSPYFHQLFTKLPTAHPLVYLRDVRQAELEALLEFIYRGEVSVANSELTGLIKIAESLRIKGLGDVSQRDPTSTNKTFREKRSSSHFAADVPSPAPRPTKSSRFYTHSEPKECKLPEMDFSSLLTAAHENLSHREKDFNMPNMPYSHLGTMPNFHQMEGGTSDNQDSMENLLRESKLRSCLEGQDLSSSLAYAQLFGAQYQKKMSTHVKRENDSKPIHRKKARLSKETIVPSDNIPKDQETKSEPNLVGGIKQEIPSNSSNNSPNLEMNTDDVILPNIRKLYESGELGQSILTKLLNSWQQHQQTSDEDIPPRYSPVPHTSMQDNQMSPPAKETKSMTCQLCGATIKHIANFRRHMKQHLNPRRFPCPWCTAAFGRKDNLKTHTRKHHPAEVESQEQVVGMSSAAHDGSGGEESRTGETYNGLEGDNSPNSDATKNEPETPGEDGLVIAEEDDFDEGEDGDINEDFEDDN